MRNNKNGSMIDTTPISLRRIAYVSLLTALAACASVDFDYPKTESTAVDSTGDTFADRQFSEIIAAHPGESGFWLLFDGIDALALRLLMAERAERSIDTQYYLITNDLVGYVFIGSLLKAADRGVRVRLLLDDIQTKGYDAGMAALDSHPNFEVRIFNPWSGRGSRMGLTEFGRINRRMHNKSFTIDNRATIIGGRNIADEYFGARQDVNYADVDVFAVGPVVNEVSTMFDSYWNSITAVPVPGFAKMPDNPQEKLKELRARIEDEVDKVRDTQYAEAVKADYEAYIDRNASILTWAPYELAYDSPDKAQKDLAAEADSIVTTLAAAVDRAEKELIVISPYFVPRKSGVEYFQTLRDRGLEVTVITNSLAATNHAIVHSGYAPSRKPLLEMGVKIYEVKHTLALGSVERGGGGASLATLHTKAFIVDRDELFVGSFNWDPRSIHINTELGVIIKSPQLAGDTAALIDAALDTRTYEVILNEKGQLRWVDRSSGEDVILTKEPDTTWGRRFNANFMRILPIRGQL